MARQHGRAKDMESRGSQPWGARGRAQEGRGVLRRQGRDWRALQPGAGRAHLSWIGAEALDEVDMAPRGWKGESR